ncbi:adenylate/guanylate cyclase domain-containing protein [Vitiosangium sp. GDMCC 1.1324]|uniref:adenylate/guanylate cyclase domain-containing protein n=1 Tax=Vitiosangium sp. (strain GDMCC 1.1324) TaxID=2138576 RepID=UPI00130E96B6|nr:adenylate/guanylate cyclase domain-containing protein [Vitiosangium sp. GDMCC 1.1324]
MSDLLRRAQTALFEHSPDGVLVLDSHHRIVEANGAAQRLFGEQDGALQGRPIAELLPEWTPPEPLSPEDPPRDAELVWHGSVGSPRQARVLSVRCLPLPEGRVVLLRDLTAHAEVEASLRQQKEYYESLVLHSPVAIVTINLRFTVVSWNPAAERLFGYTAREAIGRNILRLVASEGPIREEAELTAREALQRGRVRSVTRRLRKDGTPVDVELLALPVMVEGQQVGFIAIYHDITELHRLHEQELAHLRTIQRERERADQLLLNVLPKPVADRLKQGQRIIVENSPDVTVLFADLVDFTRFAAQHTPPDVLQVLNMVFSVFDQLTDEFGVEKVKTIGDAYMAVGGLTQPRSDHAEAMAGLALAMRAELLKLGEQLQIPLHLRIGIHSGPVIAGVISGKKFAYDLWGDTVNTASRMESHGVVDGIHLSEAVHERLQGRYLFQDQGVVNVKGKGPMRTWLLLGAA